ncbi:MAG: (5-formylfuran-3-yl)methyl phosphate synthase, partial [Planctomycetota bacterium]
MTRLLVSVRNAQEAQAAHRGGAQLIDLKEPRQGSLGAVPPADWPSIQAALPSSVPLSVALG